MNNKKIGLFIADLRKEKNMTQKSLANKLYVSDKAVSKWERGICMPDIALMEKLANILCVGVSDILKGERIEKITKQNSDEIVKESISFFQKDYFKKKSIKMISIIGIFLIIGYFLILIIGELNNGLINWSIWGNEYSIEVPSFSLIKSKRNTKEYLKALQNYDYNTIELMLKENEIRDNDILVNWITFEEYIEALKNIEKEKVQFTKYKLLYCFRSRSNNKYALNYTCTFDLTFNHKGINYMVSLNLENYNGKISIDGVSLTSQNYDYWMKREYEKEYESIHRIKDKELRNNIEKIFFRY